MTRAARLRIIVPPHDRRPRESRLSSSASCRARAACFRACARPAQLHLGNYHGALKNWIELQYEYECYFFVADCHALTTGYEDTRGSSPTPGRW